MRRPSLILDLGDRVPDSDSECVRSVLQPTHAASSYYAAKMSLRVQSDIESQSRINESSIKVSSLFV